MSCVEVYHAEVLRSLSDEEAESIARRVTLALAARLEPYPRYECTVTIIGFDSARPVELQRWLDDGGPEPGAERC